MGGVRLVRGCGGGGEFGFEGFDLRPWNVTGAGLDEVFSKVALGMLLADPDGPGLDAVGAQLAGQPDVVNGFALAHLGPRAVKLVVEVVEELSGEEAVSVFSGKGQGDVQEERAERVGVVG